MSKTKVGCRMSSKGYENTNRRMVNEIVKMLDGTYEDLESYCEINSVVLGVGHHSVDIGMFPESWDIIEHALMWAACWLIEQDELQKYPYYNKILVSYSDALGMPMGSFRY